MQVAGLSKVNMMSNEDKSLSISVSVPQIANAEHKVSILENASRNLIEPFLDGAELVISVVCNTKRTQKVRDPSNINWRKIVENDPIIITIEFTLKKRLESGLNPYLGLLSIGCLDQEDKYSTIAIGITPEYIGKAITKSLQHRFVEWFLKIIQQYAGINGYIMYDQFLPNASSPSTYEYSIGLHYLHVSKHLGEQARGYFWGNFLNLQHIATLGGKNQLVNLPGLKIQEVDSLGYYIQLTEDVNSLTLANLALLKDFVRPILPQPIAPVSFEYQRSWPYMLIHDDHAVGGVDELLPNPQISEHRLETPIYEARSWLAQTNHQATLAANRFETIEDARKFVKKLCDLGAEVFVQLSLIVASEDVYADSLIVILPSNLKQREALFKIYAQELKREFLLESDELIADSGETELHFWWD